MKAQFLGHSAFYIETESAKILIDPFLTGNPMAKHKPEDFDDVDYILITHGHGDHMGDALEIAKRSAATVITNFEIANHLSRSGIHCHPMHIGGRYKFEFGTVKMTPALHGSAIETESGSVNGGNPAGFVLNIDGKKMYHAGDTGLSMDMKLLEIEDIDVALLPIGGNFTMDITDALLAVSFIKPKVAIPMHYNTFDVIRADPDEFVEGLADDVKGVVLKVGETYSW